MEFRTPISKIDCRYQITYNDSLLSIGSCFSQHMGRRLYRAKFDILNNPLGILYNPHTIFHSLDSMLDGHPPADDDIFEKGGIWKSFLAHSSVSAATKSGLLQSLEMLYTQTSDRLRKVDWIFVTLGSSHVWRSVKNGRIVANCHQFPSKQFSRERLEIQEITGQASSLIEKVRDINPDCKWLLTVSPIRHLRDGMVANQRSKAVLLLAVEQLCLSYDHVSYFPSYEILMDDLRDYRFYANDMVHPSESALQYIFEHFAQSFLEKQCREQMGEVEKLLKGFAHRPFHPESRDYLSFREKLIAKARMLEKESAIISFEDEINQR